MDTRVVGLPIGTARGLEPAAFVVLIPGIDDDGVGGIQIAMSSRPLDGLTDMSGEFVGRVPVRIEDCFMECGSF